MSARVGSEAACRVLHRRGTASRRTARRCSPCALLHSTLPSLPLRIVRCIQARREEAMGNGSEWSVPHCAFPRDGTTAARTQQERSGGDRGEGEERRRESACLVGSIQNLNRQAISPVTRSQVDTSGGDTGTPLRSFCQNKAEGGR